MQTRQDYVKGMVNDAYSYAMESYDEVPTDFDKIYDTEDSSAAYEQYTSVLGPTSLTETEEGEEISRDTNTEGFTVYCKNRKWATELPMTNETIDDDQKMDNFLKTWAQGLGEASRSDKETFHFNLFNYGGYTAGHNVFNNAITNVITPSYGNFAYDAKPFLNLSDNIRTAKHGGTYYNAISALTLNEAGIRELYQLMCVTNALNEAGRKITLMPTILLCQYGSDNWFNARRTIESQAQVEGAHAGIENLWRNKFTVIGSRFITSSTFWALIVPKKGLKSLARKPLTIDYYEDKRRDAQIVRGIIRFGACVNNFRTVTAANIATS